MSSLFAIDQSPTLHFPSKICSQGRIDCDRNNIKTYSEDQDIQSTPGFGESSLLKGFISKIGIHLNRGHIDM